MGEEAFRFFMKVIIGILVALVLAVSVYFGYMILGARAKQPNTNSITLPSSFNNPFSEKPKTSFSRAENPPPAVVNPFAQPTAAPTTYQNPFASSPSADQPYQNPFEALR